MTGPLTNWLIAAIIIVVFVAIAELWFEPEPKVRLTIRYLAAGAIVIVAIRVFMWFIGW